MSTPAIPVLPEVPGGGTSFDPAVTDQLALNDHLYLQEWDKYRAIMNYLLAVKNWKENSLQQVGKGPIAPPPIPPAGYTLPLDPPPPPPPAPSFTPRVEERSQFGTYPAPGDINPAGTVIVNPYQAGKTLTKVEQKTPFGIAQYWIDTPEGK